tara:strand:- start:410 stop:772 length:363 start_codon:yes stop_codon:yes gene_type:complete
MSEKNIFDESIILQIRAKEVGLDWLEVRGIIDKIKEETAEIESAIEKNDEKHVKEELGDLLFTLISLSRHLKINPNHLLESANNKFQTRFEKVLSILQGRGKEIAEPDEMSEIWNMIKKL